MKEGGVAFRSRRWNGWGVRPAATGVDAEIFFARRVATEGRLRAVRNLPALCFCVLAAIKQNNVTV